jgi:hypothetical protein
MRLYNKLIFGAAVLSFAMACEDGIDPISAVDPGPDTQSPTVVISNPSTSKITIPFTDQTTDLQIEFAVTDDIEIKNISLLLDGAEVESYNSFTDYRRASRAYLYDDLAIGMHTLEIVAEDAAGKTASSSHAFEVTNVYEPVLESEVFYMPFENNTNDLISLEAATPVGTPGFAEGKSGKAYAGAANSYLTFPINELTAGTGFTAAFWYKLNSTPDRSGILTIAQPDPTNNNRTTGFRLFREATGSGQTIKLNVGNGTADSWFDGGAAASLPNGTTEWAHVAFTISATEVKVYLNGQVVSQGSSGGVSWANCTALSIASGAPNFTEWGHVSDLSLYDELKIFNTALTLEEIQLIMGDE